MSRSIELFCFASLVSIGCSGSGLNGNAAVDMADNSQPAVEDMATAPADLSLPHRDPTNHPDLPQLTNFGGPTIHAMEVYTIVWPGDEDTGVRAERFHRWMMTSDYWTQSMSEYGVGAGKSMGLVVMPTAAPKTIDDSGFTPLIANLIKDGTLPHPNANTVFAFILPSTTQSTLYGQTGCQYYGGYHSETNDNTNVPYEVNLQCPGFGSGSAFDQLTDVISHEGAEVASDPHPSRPGWLNDSMPLGGEIGDLCVGLDAQFTATFDEADAGTLSETYVVTRIYSQQAAGAGTSDPCVPAPKRPYFNVGVEPADWQVTQDPNTTVTALAKIEPYAFGDVGIIKWQLEQQPGNGVKLSPTSGQAMAGDTIPIQVTITSSARQRTFPIAIYAQSAKGGTNQWFSTITVNGQ